ncbi:hypothetical protein [Chitinophaga agri]|uniref:Uncharacterized protein n=1 Tax=Chitinophaga agri TaxID=2703787 RepID=A0A6B9ZG70_9BACT|nr:hypothetical protein [Chitinophaga agri]QHS61056.1 hypothetical protein GWR21_16050 [Chitinophaga agri]
MNYIIHLNAFFTKAEGDRWLTPYHQSLYLTLFRLWNKSRFKHAITIYRDITMAKSKIGSKGTYYRCLKDLANAGYIHYYPSGVRFEAATVTIVPFLDVEQSNTGARDMDLIKSTSDTAPVPHMDPIGTRSDTGSVPDVVHFPKQEEKRYINNHTNGIHAINNKNDSYHNATEDDYQQPF